MKGEPLRRQFRLPIDDEEYLDKSCFEWETVKDGAERLLILYDYPIPEGYNREKADMLVKLLAYPDGKLDMTYFDPPLELLSKRTIPNLSIHPDMDNRPWQQWSRHETTDAPWRVGEYTIHHFLMMVRAWLNRELNRK